MPAIFKLIKIIFNDMKKTNINNYDVTLRLYKKMYLIREVEEHIRRVYSSDVIKSPVHLSIGQEAISVGICDNLNKNDIVSNGYRCHASYIAKNGNLLKFMAELYGKSNGCGGGKAGSMHMVDIENGVLGSSAVVGTTIPISAGYAWALKQKSKKNSSRVVVSFFGDGATEEGCFYETINFSALQKLPILFVCENNGLAIHSKLNQRWASNSIIERVKSFGIKSIKVDNGDIYQIHKISKDIINELRKGNGPIFLECKTYRWLEHVGIEDDHSANYRDTKIYNMWKKNDQLKILHDKLELNVIKKLHLEVKKEIAKAITYAESGLFPDTQEELLRNVYSN